VTQKVPILLDPETVKKCQQSIIRPPKQSAADHEEAVAIASKATEQLLKDLQDKPDLMSALEDPKLGDVLLEFQFDPENAMKKYGSDCNIMKIMREFSKLLEKQFS
jgi:hypothetical protein